MLVFIQQTLVGLSTYFIGVAGMSIAEKPAVVMECIVLFFGAIILAYCFGSFAFWVTTRLGNDAWKKYYQRLFADLSKNPGYGSNTNKSLTNTWVCSEAFSRLEVASTFCIDSVSIIFNILFTLVALFAVLGPLIAGSIFVALIASFLVISVAHCSIDKLACEIQNSKLGAFVSIQGIWDHLFFGNRGTRYGAEEITREKVATFFQKNEKYKFFEQCIACMPIFISIPLLIWAIFYEVSHAGVMIGALVAILPRTLQLFQNVHTANMYAGQFILIKGKLMNLERFTERLETQDFKQQIYENEIEIQDQIYRHKLTVQGLLQRIEAMSSAPRGRFLITGCNGSGKSSLLRVMKALLQEAVLLGPGIQLAPHEIRGSTGESQIEMIEMFMQQKVKVFLLDEWDANLDMMNTNTIDARLNDLAQDALIVEVRHKSHL